MKNALLSIVGLTFVAALAEGILLLQIHLDPWRLAALMESLALLLGVFVAFTLSQSGMVVRWWRRREQGWWRRP